MDDNSARSRRGEYEPTPEEIAAACLEIQAKWSPLERKKRLRGDTGRKRQELQPRLSKREASAVFVAELFAALQSIDQSRYWDKWG